MSDTLVMDWIEKIESTYFDGEIAVAKSLLVEAIEETDAAPQLLKISGLLEYIEGNYKQAIELIERAMFEITLSITAQMTLANALLKVGECDKVEVVVEFLVEQIVRVPCSMLTNLTYVACAIGRHDLAHDVCVEAFRRHPKDHCALFGIGFHMLRCNRDPDKARVYLEQAVEMSAGASFYRAEFSALLIDLGDPDAAYEQIKAIPLEDLPKFYDGNRKDQFRELLRGKQDFLRLAIVLTVEKSARESQ